MAYTLTQEQADDVVRMLGFDGLVDDSQFINSVAGPFYHYFLEDGTIIEVGDNCQVQHQELVEDDEEGLVPRDKGDISATGVDYYVVELKRDGLTRGYIDLCTNVDALAPEQRHIHDLRMLDVCERLMRDAVKPF